MSSAVFVIRSTEKVPPQAQCLSIDGAIDKASLLMALASACDFPAYFSPNWDGAWDCLLESDVAHLLLDCRHSPFIVAEDLAIFLQLIEEAYAYHQRPQLWILEAQ